MSTYPFNSFPSAARSAEVTTMDTNPISYLTGSPGASATLNNVIYTPITNNPAHSSLSMVTGRIDLRIHRFNGTLNDLFCVIPRELAASTTDPTNTKYITETVTSMLAANGMLFAATERAVSTSSPWTASDTYGGDVWMIDPSSASVTRLGTIGSGNYAVFTGTYIPYSLCFHNGRLWCGTIYRTDTAQKGTISSIRPGIDTQWVLQQTQSQGRATSFLCSYNGVLYAGSWGTSTNVVEAMDALGNWTTSLTVASGASSGFLNAVVFKGNLYVSHFKTSGLILTIRKFDGSSWTTVYTNSGGTNAAPTVAAWVANGVMYFGGGGENLKANLFSSTDGTTFTDRTSNLPAAVKDHMGISAVGFILATAN